MALIKPSATNQGESVVTDEPKNPIDQPSETPESGAADGGVGGGDMLLSSAPAVGADPPAEAPQPPVEDGAQAAPVDTPVEAETPKAPAEVEAPVEAETPEEPAEAETPVEAETPEEPAEAEAPVEAETPEAAGEPPAADPAEPPAVAEEAEAAEPGEEEEDESPKMDWYILKVQSNREDSIRDGLMRRVAIAGLDDYFGNIIVPIEQVTEFKAGKKRITKRKLYPGYLVVQMEINDDTWFMVRETPGIGDFTGAAGHPTPMLPHEVSRILARQDEKTDQAPKLKIAFSSGDRVKINEGTFDNFEGEVHTIDETNGRVTVMINIFGRSTPVELEYWQIESI
jgi:transcriptional antiterminator NusG